MEHNGGCAELGTGCVFFRIPRAAYVENVRAKTNMKTHPDPLLLILSGNKTRLSGHLIGEPCLTVTANIDDHCVSFSRVVRE